MTFVNSQTEKDANCTQPADQLEASCFRSAYDSTTKIAGIGGEAQYIGVMPPCYAGIRETTEVDGKSKSGCGNDSRVMERCLRV